MDVHSGSLEEEGPQELVGVPCIVRLDLQAPMEELVQHITMPTAMLIEQVC